MRRPSSATWVLLLASVLGAATSAVAQGVDGYVAVMVDAVPDRAVQAAELRSRVFAERRIDLGGWLRITGAGFVEGLLRDRGRSGLVSDAILRPLELHAELTWSKADLRVGWTRVVWGRLDEFQPTDVVNPIDLTRFFFEGRVEGRLPVAMVRGRVIPSDRLSVEAIYVPFFRRGRFDQLDEETAPFNLAPAVPRVSHAPAHDWANGQGGVRASATTGRVDWSVSAYRGFEPLPVYELGVVGLTERFPRFTMVGGDFETARGQWGFRGEVAAFVDRTLQLAVPRFTADGSSLEFGLGADRPAGGYRISANLLVARRWTATAAAFSDSDATIVASIDRSFARETRRLRTLAVYNPAEESAFGRVIASFNLRDNVTVEASGGVFTGSGTDALSRLAARDFVYARLKVFF